ncbi:MAG TPA: PilN domain-containing protein [Patescibacteria group bacterium]|nr:PilN domain-containing protein [Patescibacteria group bacterium]
MTRLDINPEVEQGIINAQNQSQAPAEVPKLKAPIRTSNIVTTGFLITGFFLLVFGGLFLFNVMKKSSINSTSNKIGQANDEILKMGDVNKQAEALYSQINNLEGLWAGRNLWSNVMTKLSGTMYKNVKFNTVSFASPNTLTITGQTDSLSNVAKMLASLEGDKNFLNAKLTSVTVEEGVVSFNIGTGFTPSLLGASSGSK